MKYQELKKAINRPIFTRDDILLAGFTAYASQLSGWRKRGLIVMLKSGVYCFADRQASISREHVASILYTPSYISLESAMSHYGFIPEAVFTLTSVTTRTTRKVENVFGVFSYRKIHSRLFFGYVPIEVPGGKYLLAEPEKALLDYLYLNLGSIETEEDIRGLRLNGEELKKTLDEKKLETYLQEFGIQKLNRITHLILSLC